VYRESNTSRVAFQFEIIFGILTIRKCDYAEVEIAMFQELANHLQLIIGPCASIKFELGEVKKANMLVVARHCKLIFFVS